ncbi:MAG: hypothetical protein JNM17_15065 [Archangium sp.]|nr:hypothetical protein [Archangium sp.]
MDDVFPFIGAVVVGLGALAVVYSRVLRARVLRGDIARLTLGQIALPLFDEYEDGALYPTVLTQCEARRNEPTTPDVINKFVCLDVAAGRYREAMAWHDVSVAPRNEPERLIALNVAEALACLGRLEDSLRATDWHAETDFLRAGVASHRAWVLSMLARTDEARAVLMPTHPLIPVLGKFQAEWYFSLFCIELAERKFDAAVHSMTPTRALSVSRLDEICRSCARSCASREVISLDR